MWTIIIKQFMNIFCKHFYYKKNNFINIYDETNYFKCLFFTKIYKLFIKLYRIFPLLTWSLEMGKFGTNYMYNTIYII